MFTFFKYIFSAILQDRNTTSRGISRVCDSFPRELVRDSHREIVAWICRVTRYQKYSAHGILVNSYVCDIFVGKKKTINTQEITKDLPTAEVYTVISMLLLEQQRKQLQRFWRAATRRNMQPEKIHLKMGKCIY